MADDPERLINIRKSGDFNGWRSRGVAKEPWTYEWLKDLGKGSVLYDIGACVGTYSLMAGARGALVYAFEPLPVNYAELQANIRLNHLSSNVFAVPLAASAHDGFIELHVHNGGTIPGYGLASAEKAYEDSDSIWVPSAALDTLSVTMFNPPTHIKIDVEGFEYMVIYGMQRFFREKGVESMIVEVDGEENEEKISQLMYPFGYFGEEVGERRSKSDMRTLVYEQAT